MTHLGWVGQMVGRMRLIVNYNFQNYFVMEKGDMACLHIDRLMALNGL
jgi:hypothetical protein